jgi:hypothetical protein
MLSAICMGVLSLEININREHTETHPIIRIGGEEIWSIFLGKLEIDVNVSSNRLFFKTEGKYAILQLI